MDIAQFQNLVRQLASLSTETEWAEWKFNNAESQEIGEYISALSNAAALIGRLRAYILWGIEEATHQIIGTSFRPRKKKEGNQELESWLLMHLDPHVEFRIHEGEVDGKYMVLFEIFPATNRPIRFRNEEYIRIGSSKKNYVIALKKRESCGRFLTRYPSKRASQKNRY